MSANTNDIHLAAWLIIDHAESPEFGKEASMKPHTLWTIIGTSTAILSGVATRQALKHTTRRHAFEPPVNPDDPDVRWREALLWGAASGVAVGVARILGWKVAASGLRRARRTRRGRRLLSRIED